MDITQTLKQLFAKLNFIQRLINRMTTPDQILQMIRSKAKQAGITEDSDIFKNGLATLKWESGLNPNAVCFNLTNGEAISGVYTGEDKVITDKGDEYILNKEAKTLTTKAGKVIYYNSWDRGIGQWNDKYWPKITDAMAFNPNIAIDWFWPQFKIDPNTWIGFKIGAFRNYL